MRISSDVSSVGFAFSMGGIVMKKLFALGAAALVVSSAPAMAAATTTIYVANAGVPSYGTASVIEAFTGTAGTAVFPTASKTVNAVTPAYTGTLTETPTSGLVNSTNGSAYAKYITGVSGATGTSLGFKGGSVTLDFGASGIQFLKFVIGNYQTSASLFVQYVGDASMGTTNLLATSGLGSGSGTNWGTILMDAGGGVAIKAIRLSTTANELSIDSIAAAAPEPAAWLMMILGFGLVGAQLRNRRRTTVKFAAA